jgi:lipoprotein-anchoring transpeptidase ErfK/SrfK
MEFRYRRAAPTLLLALLLGLLAAPAAQAQTESLFFPVTGHNLSDDQGFLRFWRDHDGERLLGYPLTEAFESGGQFTQYFTRGRLEQVTDASGATQVRTGRVAAEYAEMLFRSFAPAPPHRASATLQEFTRTGHTLRPPFLAFWQANGGEAFFGAPLSESLWEMTEQGQRQVQYFETARLERVPALAGVDDEIQVSELGRALAQLRGLDTTPRSSNGGAAAGPIEPVPPAESAAIPAAPEEPSPAEELYPAQPAEPLKVAPAPAKTTAAKPAASSKAAPRASSNGKRILIDLSKQWLYAYQNDEVVFDAPIATGRDGMETPTGNYAVYAKTKSQTMRGVTDGEGWVVPNVPNVMYFNGDVALHGTYWHNLFGSGVRVSHGCVNVPLDSAAWLYNWTPIGTPVRVTY